MSFFLDYVIAVGSQEHWVTGSNEPIKAHGKTELLTNTNTWSTQQDFPFGTEYLVFLIITITT